MEDMIFPRSALLQYIQGSQLETIENMNPDAVWMAYKTAKGYVTSEIGMIYNMEEFFCNKCDPDDTLWYIMLAITCWHVAGAAINKSESLMMAYEDACLKLRTIKAGFARPVDLDLKEEPNARITIVDNHYKYLG